MLISLTERHIGESCNEGEECISDLSECFSNVCQCTSGTYLDDVHCKPSKLL